MTFMSLRKFLFFAKSFLSWKDDEFCQMVSLHLLRFFFFLIFGGVIDFIFLVLWVGLLFFFFKNVKAILHSLDKPYMAMMYLSFLYINGLY